MENCLRFKSWKLIISNNGTVLSTKIFNPLLDNVQININKLINLKKSLIKVIHKRSINDPFYYQTTIYCVNTWIISWQFNIMIIDIVKISIMGENNWNFSFFTIKPVVRDVNEYLWIDISLSFWLKIYFYLFLHF